MRHRKNQLLFETETKHLILLAHIFSYLFYNWNKSHHPLIQLPSFFIFYAGFSDWLIMKSKVKQMTSLINASISLHLKTDIPKKKFFATKIFFLLVNFFMSSFQLECFLAIILIFVRNTDGKRQY